MEGEKEQFWAQHNECSFAHIDFEVPVGQTNRDVLQAVLKLSKEHGTRNEDLGFVRVDMVFEVMGPDRNVACLGGSM